MDVERIQAEQCRNSRFEPRGHCFADTFVGREKELQGLRDLWKKTLRGNGRFVVIFGEAGIGKRSFVEHLASGIEGEAHRSVLVSLRNTPHYEPFLPIRKLTTHLNPLNHTAGNDGNLHQEADRAADENFTAFDSESLYSLQADQRLVQQRLVSQILEAAQNGPLFLALFDGHHAPLTTWQFIHYLSESISDHPILLIVTVPEEDSFTRSSKVNAYMEVIQRMNRERLVQKVHLRPFTERDIRKFLFLSLKKTDFSSSFIESLMKVTRGVPGNLTRMIALMIENNFIYREGEVWFDQENLSREDLLRLLDGEGRADNIEELLSPLTDEQTTLLQYAALFEGKFDHLVLSAVLQRSRIRVVRDLVALQQLRILEELGEGDYQFRNVGIQNHFLENLMPDEKRRLHLKIAQAIESNYPEKQGEKVYLLAYHYFCSGEKAGAVRYLHLAGKKALKNFAFLESHGFYQKILSFLPEVIAENPSTECIQILQEAAWVTRVLGNRQESLRYFEQALELCAQLGEEALQIQLQVQIGLTHFQLNEWDAARKNFEACLNYGAHAPLPSVAMSHYGLGNVYFELAEYAKAEENYQKALELTRQLDMKIITANILNNLGAVENVRGNRLRAIMLYSQSIPIYQGLGDDLGLARVYNNIGISYADEGDWQKANEFYGKSLSVSDGRGLIPVKTLTFLNRVYTLIHLKAYEEAREYNFKAYRHLKKLNDELGLAEYYKNQGIIEREAGDRSIAEQHFSDALKKYGKLQHRLGIAETEFEFGVLCVRQKKATAAIGHFEQAANIFREMGLQNRVREVEKQISGLSEYFRMDAG